MLEAKKELARLIANAAPVSEDEALLGLKNAKGDFGDVSSKVAFLLAGRMKKSPLEIAKEIAGKITGSDFVESASAAGPYINFTLSKKFFLNATREILKRKEQFGSLEKTKKKIMIEFFDGNTHKGVHIGHIRTISLGESLSRISEFAGNSVIRVNYQGDIGPHVAKCLWGFINLYHEKAPKENRGIWLGKVYAEASKKASENPAVENEIKETNLKLYAGDKKLTELWKKTRQWCLDDFEEFYAEFDVKFDELYFESQTQEIGMQIAKDALKNDIAKIDQGATIIDLKDENLGVVIIITREGYPLYHTKDLGLAKLKFDKYPDLDKSIHVVGKEQEFYFKQLFRAFEKLGMKRAAGASHHLIYELVMLPEGKMSSRDGTMVLYSDMREKLLEVAREEITKRHPDRSKSDVEKTALDISLGALKFSMLHRENNRVIVFDWNEALKLEGDTGPYLQYACVRTSGILNKAKESGLKPDVSAGHEFINEEKRLLKKLSEFPEIVEKSSRDLSPSYIANYLLEVASLFNKFYDTSRVLNAEKEEERKTRLALVNSTNLVMKNGLYLLNIPCPEKM